MSDTKAKTGKPWKRILLVASVGLNVLFIGMFAGAHFAGGGPNRAEERASPRLPLGPYARAFSKEDRAELRKAFEGRKAWVEGSRRQMRDFGQEMINAMRADPFEAEAVSDILERQNAVLTGFQAEGRMILLERIGAMTPDQRAAFADKLEKGLKRGKRDR